MTEPKLSKGLYNIGLEHLYDVVNSLPSHLPIVSVGQGDGYVEELLRKEREREVIGVDPNPSEHTGWVVCEPGFPLVSDLLKECPDLVGNCIVFLNWPSPSSGEKGEFDSEAVELLKPVYVLTVVDTTGGAGSAGFLRFLSASGCQPPVELFLDLGSKGVIESDYEHVGSVHRRLDSNGSILGDNLIQLVLLQKEGWNRRLSHLMSSWMMGLRITLGV